MVSIHRSNIRIISKYALVNLYPAPPPANQNGPRSSFRALKTASGRGGEGKHLQGNINPILYCPGAAWVTLHGVLKVEQAVMICRGAPDINLQGNTYVYERRKIPHKLINKVNLIHNKPFLSSTWTGYLMNSSKRSPGKRGQYRRADHP